ncbi:MAG: metal-dependent hydrolase [Pseudomonadota bacterium]
MKIIWLGHAGFRIEIAGQVLLIDPWLAHPHYPEDRRAEAIGGATQILLTHGHFDHTDGVLEMAQELGVPIAGMVELAGILGDQGAETIGFNFGGSISIGDVTATLVPALHSSSIMIGKALVYAGEPAGFILRGEGKTLYISGDTDVSAEMGAIGARYAPQIGILSAGGFYTMDMAGAAFAAKTYFNFETVIPCHYKTFPALEQDAAALKAGLPGVNVIEPEVLGVIEL